MNSEEIKKKIALLRGQGNQVDLAGVLADVLEAIIDTPAPPVNDPRIVGDVSPDAPATLGTGVTIGDQVGIGRLSRIGAGTEIGYGVQLGNGSSVDSGVNVLGSITFDTLTLNSVDISNRLSFEFGNSGELGVYVYGSYAGKIRLEK